MTLIQTIIVVIASLALVKGIIVCLIPRPMIRLAKQFTKSESAMRKAGMIGIIIALLLFVLSRFL